jgi:ribosome-dependent ATPase
VSQAVIEVRRATVRYGSFTAVEDASLAIRRGEVYGLLGPNGAGKTTLMRALCGLVPLAAGRAAVLGHDVATDVTRVRASIGYMSQHFALYADLTCRENLDFFAGIHGLRGAEARGRKADLVALTGLVPYLDRQARKLSGGWKQRLALACALLHEPPVLFLDEPTAGIDPVARRDLWDLLFRLAADGMSMIVSTHYMDEAERCSHVGYMQGGRLLASGTPAELKRLPVVTPPGTRRLEIVGPDATSLLSRLRGRPMVREATIFGQAVHALVDDACDLDELGCDGALIRNAEPGLEDVFVRLVEAEDAGEIPDGPPGHRGPEPLGSPAPFVPPQPAPPPLSVPSPTRVLAVARKEVVHLRRDPLSLILAVAFPILQLFLLSYSYDLNVRDLRTIVLDQSGTQESRQLVRRLVNTETFRVVKNATRDEELQRAIVAGAARVAFKIPEDYARRIKAGQTPNVLLLVDGSDSRIAVEAVSISSSVGAHSSVLPVGKPAGKHSGSRSRPAAQGAVEFRPRVLFNPESYTPFFILPGMIVLVCQAMAIERSVIAVLREKDGGTLDLVRMISGHALELVLGKLSVYLALVFGEFGLILLIMRFSFGLSARGPLTLLLGLSLVFILATIGYGLLIAIVSPNRQVAFSVMGLSIMPCMFLTGLLLPLDSMPPALGTLARLIPATWLIDASRGIILRGAGWEELQPHILILGTFAIVMVSLSLLALRKTLR